MKTLIITIVVLLLNISGLVGQPAKKYTKEDLIKSTKITIQDYRNSRFLNIPYKSYKEDSDVEVIGQSQIQDSYIGYKKEWKKIIIQENRQKQTNKFKSTYLDFTILTEENIS
jgi:hypothetical protein